MATAAGPDWTRLPLPLPTAPDNPSPVFPERPIRPLPKRRLRSRLSEGEANSIDRPLDPSSSPSVFGSPTGQRESSLHLTQSADTYTPRNPDFGRLVTPGAYESDEDREDEREVSGQRSSWTDSMRATRGSTASSIDGESFENTNNKKKRKIPLNHTSGNAVDANDSDPGYGPSSAAWQLDGSGPGSRNGAGAPPSTRGRYMRGPKGGKQPLTPSVNGLNHDGYDGNPSSLAKDPRAQYPTGQENRRAPSAQHQQGNNGQVNDFTFTAPSESSKHLNQASRAGVMQHPAPGQPRTAATHGTQTTPNGAAQRPAPNAVPPNQPAGAAQPEPPVDRPSRGELLRRQAVDRKRDQRMMNRRKPITRADVEICDYCLYEAIFRERPKVLLREYELKELGKRREQENRRRLLEKAKAKSRKTRKASRSQSGKTNSQGGNANTNSHEQYGDGSYDPQSPGDDYYDDDEFAEAEHGDYDDEGYDEYPPPLEPGTGGGVHPPGGYEYERSPVVSPGQ